MELQVSDTAEQIEGLAGLAKSWSFWMPATLVKERGATVTKIKGFASLQTPDHIGEEVIQTGLDWSHFRREGLFKWGHGTADRPSDPGDFVAKATKAEIVTAPDGTPATYVEGNLLDTEKAKRVVELAKALEKQGQQLGLSVEGGVITREDATGRVVTYSKERKGWFYTDGTPAGPGKRIAKAIVVDVAIDPHPMHPDARATIESLARSLSAAMEGGVTAGYGSPEPADASGNGAPLIPQSPPKKKGKRGEVAAVTEPLTKGEDEEEGEDAEEEDVASDAPEHEEGEAPMEKALTVDQAKDAILHRYPGMSSEEATALLAVIETEFRVAPGSEPVATGATP